MNSGSRSNSIPLSEKIGAMNVIDELRRRRAKIEEYLDLPRRRAETAHEIRNYYQRQGIPFDDELIEQGVREFFSRRLVYETPPLGRFRKRLTHTLIARSRKPQVSGAQQKKPGEKRESISQRVASFFVVIVCNPVLLFGLVGIVLIGGVLYLDIKRNNDHAAYFEYLSTGSTPQLDEYRRSIATIEALLEKRPNAVANRALARAKQQFEQVYQLLPAPVDKDTDSEEKQRRQDLLEINSELFLSNIHYLIESVDGIEELLDLSDDINSVLESDDYRRASLRDPEIRRDAERLSEMHEDVDRTADYKTIRTYLGLLKVKISRALAPVN